MSYQEPVASLPELEKKISDPQHFETPLGEYAPVFHPNPELEKR
jgi:hypothetical protein